MKSNLVVTDVKEAAASKTDWIARFQERPLTIFEDVFDHAHHLGAGKPRGKHLTDGISAFDGLFGNLVVDRVLSVEGGARFDIRPIESAHPCGHDVFGTHKGSRTVELADRGRIKRRARKARRANNWPLRSPAISALHEYLRLCQLCALCRRLRLLTFLAEA